MNARESTPSIVANESSFREEEKGSQNDYPLVWSEELCDFLVGVDNYQPTVPEAVSTYCLERSGVDVKDARVAKIVSLAADFLLSDLVKEAREISRLRQMSVRNLKRRQEIEDTLEMPDLELSLEKIRVFLRRKRPKRETL